MENEIKDITIVVTEGNIIHIRGKYRRDLETNNWHYYETTKGELLHFRKIHMIAVIDQHVNQEGIVDFFKIENATKISIL